MAAVVVMADVQQVHRIGNARHLINIAQEAVQVTVIADAMTIALKVGHVDRLKAHQRGSQAQISFGEAIAGQIAMLTQNLLQPCQRMEQRGYGFIIGRL